MMRGPTGYLDYGPESITALTGWCGLRFRMHFLEGAVRDDGHPSALSALLHVYSSLVGCRFWRRCLIYDIVWPKFVVLTCCFKLVVHRVPDMPLALFDLLSLVFRKGSWHDMTGKRRKERDARCEYAKHEMWHSHGHALGILTIWYAMNWYDMIWNVCIWYMFA